MDSKFAFAELDFIYLHNKKMKKAILLLFIKGILVNSINADGIQFQNAIKSKMGGIYTKRIVAEDPFKCADSILDFALQQAKSSEQWFIHFELKGIASFVGFINTDGDLEFASNNFVGPSFSLIEGDIQEESGGLAVFNSFVARNPHMTGQFLEWIYPSVKFSLRPLGFEKWGSVARDGKRYIIYKGESLGYESFHIYLDANPVPLYAIRSMTPGLDYREQLISNIRMNLNAYGDLFSEADIEKQIAIFTETADFELVIKSMEESLAMMGGYYPIFFEEWVSKPQDNRKLASALSLILNTFRDLM